MTMNDLLIKNDSLCISFLTLIEMFNQEILLAEINTNFFIISSI